ncbi:MAG TPA: glycosyltransferase family 4 protein [Gammaproteobacteria bacterium]|jgi:glycosyltransferase involved in cell wall biosynthesis
MKLLFVTLYIDHVLLFLLRALAQQVSLRVVHDFDNDWSLQLAEFGVSTHRVICKSRFDRRFKAELEQLQREQPCDLVQCFHGNSQLANVIHWAGRELPIVGYRGRIGHLKLRESPVAYWSVRNPQLSAVVANSSAVAAYLENFRVLKPRNVQVIPTGVDLEWIQSRAQAAFGLRSRLGLPADSFVALSMGSLRPVKNFELIVEAAKQLAPKDVHFVNLGDSRGWAEKTRGIANLHFLEFEPNPFPAIGEADVFVSTSHGEAFGRANIEAMACGKPVVGPKAGGALDQIEHDVSGRFFQPNDASDFAGQVLWYRQNPERATLHGAQAKQRVERRFSTAAMAESYLSLYRKVLAERSAER